MDFYKLSTRQYEVVVILVVLTINALTMSNYNPFMY